MVIGVDAEDRPAVLGLNRPTAYDIVLIGGLWTAQVLALRAAATGAGRGRDRPGAGLDTLAHAGGGQSGMTLHEVGRVPPLGASAGSRCSWCGTAACGRRAGVWCRRPGSR